MRRRTIIFIVIIVVIGIAVFTRPSRRQFEEYIRKESPTPPMITERNSYVFSFYDVQYFEVVNTRDSLGTKQVATPFKKATYIGVFGRFWKL
jgi:hypothetical protein